MLFLITKEVLNQCLYFTLLSISHAFVYFVSYTETCTFFYFSLKDNGKKKKNTLASFNYVGTVPKALNE